MGLRAARAAGPAAAIGGGGAREAAASRLEAVHAAAIRSSSRRAGLTGAAQWVQWDRTPGNAPGQPVPAGAPRAAPDHPSVGCPLGRRVRAGAPVAGAVGRAAGARGPTLAQKNERDGCHARCAPAGRPREAWRNAASGEAPARHARTTAATRASEPPRERGGMQGRAAARTHKPGRRRTPPGQLHHRRRLRPSQAARAGRDSVSRAAVAAGRAPVRGLA